MNRKSAIAAIEKYGVLLVYPINNRPDPRSLWTAFHPRTPMRWEWDDDGDDRVARLWHLRAELSHSRSVVYTKWFRGRATFFSRDAFVNLLALRRSPDPQNLSDESQKILATLEEDSPQSPRQLRRHTELVGRALEPVYAKALKALWERLLIVGYGEIDDGAFPSLAVGATRVIFEDLWARSKTIDPARGRDFLKQKLAHSPALLKALNAVERDRS